MISLTSNDADFLNCQHAEAVSRRCFIKKLSLIISENVQENTCARVFFNKVVVYILNKHEMTRLTCYVLRIFCVL